MKVCTKCLRDLPLDSFYALKAGFMGRAARCKACTSEDRREKYRRDPEFAQAARDRTRARALRDPDAKKSSDARYYQANRERILARVASVAPKPTQRSSPRARANSGDRRALRLGVPYCSAAAARYEELAGIPVCACHWCGWWMVGGAENVDHLVPFAQGGMHAPSNLVPSCEFCNKSRGPLTPDDWKTRRAERGF